MPHRNFNENHHNRDIAIRKKLAADETHKKLEDTNKKHHTQAAIMHAQQRERELAPFKDAKQSKKLKDNHSALQDLLSGFVTAISPIAPAISQILQAQRNVLNPKQLSSLIDMGEIFAQLPFSIANPNRSMKQNLDLFLDGMKKLTHFVTENPAIIVGVATILFPALAPIGGFLSKALGFLATLAPALRNPLKRAIQSAKNEVDLAELAIHDASHYKRKSHRAGSSRSD